MFRTSDIVLIAVMVSAAAMTYKIKSEAEAQQNQARRIQAQIHTEEDTIDLLKADWSLLTQPARLQKLTDLYKSQLGLELTDPHQIVTLDQIPRRPPVTIEDLTAGQPGGMAAAGKDGTITGAVR